MSYMLPLPFCYSYVTLAGLELRPTASTSQMLGLTGMYYRTLPQQILISTYNLISAKK